MISHIIIYLIKNDETEIGKENICNATIFYIMQCLCGPVEEGYVPEITLKYNRRILNADEPKDINH